MTLKGHRSDTPHAVSLISKKRIVTLLQYVKTRAPTGDASWRAAAIDVIQVSASLMRSYLEKTRKYLSGNRSTFWTLFKPAAFIQTVTCASETTMLGWSLCGP